MNNLTVFEHELLSKSCGRVPQYPPRILPVSETVTCRPLWSVMIPVYNCAKYLKRTLDSILVQDPGPQHMQIEVVDDYSTDADIESIVQLVGCGRIKYFRQKSNLGSLRNFETCISRSTGKILHLLHGDDFVFPGYYREMEELFERYPDAGAAFSNFYYVNSTGEKQNISNESLMNEKGILPDFLHRIAERQLIQPPAISVKRTTYEKLGSFFAVHFGEDWEMWTRIASKFPVAYSPRKLAAYRVDYGNGISHQSYLSGQNIRDISEVINIIQEYLPLSDRPRIRKSASAYYSMYAIKVANGLLLQSRKAAVEQVRGALSMHMNSNIIFWVIRFYLMYFFRIKELDHAIKKKINKYQKALPLNESFRIEDVQSL